MIVAVITACFSVVKFMKSEGRECVADPPKYYEEKTGTPCFCGNDFLNSGGETANFPLFNFTIDE